MSSLSHLSNTCAKKHKCLRSSEALTAKVRMANESQREARQGIRVGNSMPFLLIEGVNAPVCCQMTGTGRPFATGTLVISFTIDEPTTSRLRSFADNDGTPCKTVVRVPSVKLRKEPQPVDDSQSPQGRPGSDAKRCSSPENARVPKKSTASAAIVQYEKALASIGLHGFCQVQTVGWVTP